MNTQPMTTLSGIVIRPATATDLPAIRDIFNYAVRELPAAFYTEERTVAQMAEWLAAHHGHYVVYVAEEAGVVIGWGSLSRFHDRPCYDPTAEDSVYIHQDHWGRGIGTLLLGALLDAACAAGFHTLIARIVASNQASLSLHRRFGFVDAGCLREVGWKLGCWHDVIHMQWFPPAAHRQGNARRPRR